jgi:spore coat protein CotH
MPRPGFLLCLLAAFGLLPVFVPELPAQTTDDLFAADAIKEIRLSMSSRDLQQLRAHFDENTYYAVDFQWQDIRVRNAAVRSRGTASRNPTKPGLQIHFDRFVTGQQFLGFDSLVLDNLWQDPSLMREHLAMAFFARMGEPAPRESFCRLYINNVYQGVYGIVEDIAQPFLTRSFTKGDGFLFEYKNVHRFIGEYLGDDLAPYKALFEPRSHQKDPDTVLYSPIRDLFREVNHEDDAVWRDRVDALIDLKQLVRYVAIETFLAEPDGLLGFSGMNNFYLYRAPGTSRHRLIPWDKDLSFSGLESPIMHEQEENELFRRAMAYDDLREVYFKKLEQCARSARSGNWLLNEITALASVIGDAVHDDTFKPITNQEFTRAVSSLKKFARQRSGYIIQSVDTMRLAAR